MMSQVSRYQTLKVDNFDVDEMAVVLITVSKHADGKKIRIVTGGNGELAEYVQRFAEELQKDPRFSS